MMLKKTSKSLVILMSMLIVMMCLGGCSKEEQKMKTIGIVQIVEHPSLNEVRESIIEELAKRGYKDGENIKIDYQNAQGEQSNLNTICGQFVGREVEVIIAIATSSAQVAQSTTKDIPIIFSAITDPVGAKLVQNPEQPEANITGVSDAIPVESIFDLIQALTPEVKSIGFLYTSSEPNSQAAIEQAKEAADKRGLAYEEMTITNTSELKQVAEHLARRVDAIYTPTDNAISSAMPVLAEVGRETQIPIYVGADSMVNSGGYATNGVDYTIVGQETAQMVASVLEGKAIKDIPVVYFDSFKKVINKTTAEIINAPWDVDGVMVVE